LSMKIKAYNDKVACLNSQTHWCNYDYRHFTKHVYDESCWTLLNPLPEILPFSDCFDGNQYIQDMNVLLQTEIFQTNTPTVVTNEMIIASFSDWSAAKLLKCDYGSALDWDLVPDVCEKHYYDVMWSYVKYFWETQGHGDVPMEHTLTQTNRWLAILDKLLELSDATTEENKNELLQSFAELQNNYKPNSQLEQGDLPTFQKFILQMNAITYTTNDEYKTAIITIIEAHNTELLVYMQAAAVDPAIISAIQTLQSNISGPIGVMIDNYQHSVVNLIALQKDLITFIRDTLSAAYQATFLVTAASALSILNIIDQNSEDYHYLKTSLKGYNILADGVRRANRITCVSLRVEAILTEWYEALEENTLLTEKDRTLLQKVPVCSPIR